MKTLKTLCRRLNDEQKFGSKYPEFDMNDKKVHVLFLSPCLHEAGYYRMILPALELNRTSTHKAIVSHIHKWNFTKQFDDYDSPLDFRLVEWANYVVLPAMFTDVEYIMRAMREINDEIEFVMDLDVNYHELPSYHPDYGKIQPSKHILLKNLSKVDILTAPNHSILNYYNALVQKSSDEFLLYFEAYPNLLSHFTFEEIKEIKQNKSEKVRLSVLLDSSQVGDLKTIEKPLTIVLEKFKEKAELVIFGLPEKISEQLGLFKDLPVLYQKPELLTTFHHTLNELCIDIGLIPMLANPYNSSGKALNRYLDFTSCMVPVIAADISPLGKIITEGENGFIAHNEEEWTVKIEKLIAEPQLRKEVGKSAFSMAWETFSYTPKTIQRLRNIFV